MHHLLNGYAMGAYIMDIYGVIRGAMEQREMEYISFPDLVAFLKSINKDDVDDSTIGDFLLFKLNNYNPFEYGENADTLTIYHTYDLSNITISLEAIYDSEPFFKFAHSLCNGSFDLQQWYCFFLSRSFIFNELGIDEPELTKQSETYQEQSNLKKDTPDIEKTIDALNAENAKLKAEIKSLNNKLKVFDDPSTTSFLEGKSKKAHLNIIYALLTELLESDQFRNQEELILHLAKQYLGYTGLSESNIRGKFAEAKKEFNN